VKNSSQSSALDVKLSVKIYPYAILIAVANPDNYRFKNDLIFQEKGYKLMP